MLSRFQPTRLTTPVLILLAIAGVSYWANPEPWHHLSPAVQATFAVSLLVVIALALVARGRMTLRVDERGIQVCYLVGAPRQYSWKEIEAAGLFKLRFLRIPLAYSIHLRLSNGGRASIPAFFEESAPEILEKILFYKREAENAPPMRYSA
jgi:hypothetical protein